MYSDQNAALEITAEQAYFLYRFFAEKCHIDLNTYVDTISEQNKEDLAIMLMILDINRDATICLSHLRTCVDVFNAVYPSHPIQDLQPFTAENVCKALEEHCNLARKENGLGPIRELDVYQPVEAELKAGVSGHKDPSHVFKPEISTQDTLRRSGATRHEALGDDELEKSGPLSRFFSFITWPFQWLARIIVSFFTSASQDADGTFDSSRSPVRGTDGDDAGVSSPTVTPAKTHAARPASETNKGSVVGESPGASKTRPGIQETEF